jgi:hypothetical protein
MGKDSPQAKSSGKGSEGPKPAEQGAEPAENHGIQGAAREAWSGLTKWGHKAADTVVDTSSKVYHGTKEAIKSKEGQEVIAKTRDGAAKVIETAGGRSGNRTVDQVVGNAELIPGAGNVVRAAKTLNESGVTGIVRDGKGHVNKERLVRGAVEAAPVTGELATAKQLADRTGLTGKIVEKVQEQTSGRDKGKERGNILPEVEIDKGKLVKGAIEAAPVPQEVSRWKRFLDKTGLTGKAVDRVQEEVDQNNVKKQDRQQQERHIKK